VLYFLHVKWRNATESSGKARWNLGKLVLVVDDDAGLQETLQAALEFEDYEVVVAEDGLVALEKLSAVTPDLILLDIMMPRMDGYAFAKELQRRGLRASIPVVILTADGRARQKAAQIGADGYIEKPFDIPDFLDEVARHIRF
jgi:CheY-like chemotaxis protein